MNNQSVQSALVDIMDQVLVEYEQLAINHARHEAEEALRNESEEALSNCFKGGKSKHVVNLLEDFLVYLNEPGTTGEQALSVWNAAVRQHVEIAESLFYGTDQAGHIDGIINNIKTRIRDLIEI